MQTKVCFRCLVEKPLTDYYTHKAMGDGHLNKCKECTKSDTKKRTEVLSADPKWVDKEKERHREKYHRLEYRERHKPTSEAKKAITSRYSEQFPEKVRCRNFTGALRRQLNLPRTKEVHHWNYNIGFELDVIVLDRADHYFLHRFIEYDQSVMMYRTKSGDLLDTKEKHSDYFASLKQFA